MLNSVKNNVHFPLLYSDFTRFSKRLEAYEYLTWPLSDVILGIKGIPEETQ